MLIKACISKVPIEDWPPIGGWELLVHFKNGDRLDDVRKQLSVLLVDKGDSDGSSDDDDEEAIANPSKKNQYASWHSKRLGGPRGGLALQRSYF